MDRKLHLGLAFCSILALQVAAKSVRYSVDGKEYEGYYTAPAENAPLVLLVHDWDGLTDYEKKRADMLRELGYAVFAADMFGAGIRPEKIEDRRRLTGALYADRDKMRALLMGAISAAEKQGANVKNAVAMGYCFGGTVVLELARSGIDFKGYVPFHGALETPEGQDYSGTRGRIIVFHGTADSHITMDHFAALAGELEKYDVSHEMIAYGGAPHAFTVFGSDRYREEADRASWRRFKQFLEDTL